MRRLLQPVLLLVVASAACDHRESPPPGASATPAPAASTSPARALSRADFNRYALRLDSPLFWAADPDGNGAPEPAEIETLLFYPTSDSVDVARGIAAIQAYDPTVMPSGLSAAETARRRAVADDLDQGGLSVIHTDLRSSSTADKTLLRHMLVAAKSIDDIYATMRGARALASRVPSDDTASQSLFRRDWGPKCAGAKSRKDPACTAIAGVTTAFDDEYPASLQGTPDFCAALSKRPDAKAAMEDHFGVVREKDGKLVSVPYTEAYSVPMQAIAHELKAAAADETDPGETALRA
ncbi:MAG: hypothetical protein ACRELB_02900, partial [Polyangiaceae bacterium]